MLYAIKKKLYKSDIFNVSVCVKNYWLVLICSMFKELQRMYNRHSFREKREKDIKNKMYPFLPEAI